MLFQYGFRAGGFRDIMYYLQQWGVIDVFVPFILIFTIIFAVFEKIKVLKQRRFNVAVAAGIALLVIIPHIMGTYPPGQDVVEIINTSIPEAALLFIVVVMVLLMIGLIRGEEVKGGAISVILSIVSVGLLGLIFLSAVSPIPLLMRIDPALQSAIVILLIFGLIVYFIGRREPTTAERAARAGRPPGEWWFGPASRRGEGEERE